MFHRPRTVSWVKISLSHKESSICYVRGSADRFSIPTLQKYKFLYPGIQRFTHKIKLWVFSSNSEIPIGNQFIAVCKETIQFMLQYSLKLLLKGKFSKYQCNPHSYNPNTKSILTHNFLFAKCIFRTMKVIESLCNCSLFHL